MRNAIYATGLVITPELAAHAIKASRQEQGTTPEKIRKIIDGGRFAELAKKESLELDSEGYFNLFEAYLYMNSFVPGMVCEEGFYGKAETAAGVAYPEDKKTETWADDLLLMLPLERSKMLTVPAYANIAEIESELKTKLGNMVPKGFDLRPFIMDVEGAAYD